MMMRHLLHTCAKGPVGSGWICQTSAAVAQGTPWGCHQRAASSSTSTSSNTDISTGPSTSTNGLAALPAHLAALRRFNCTRPELLGQAILVRVLEVGPSQLLVDPGYYGTCLLPLHDFRTSRVHDRQGAATDRVVADGVKAGEYVVATLARYFTPFGATELAPSLLTGEARRELVWAELRQLHASHTAVWGRVLNSCGSGYAVGVAGVVCLLPFERCSPTTGGRMGVLQPFHIVSIDTSQRLVTLCDETHRPQVALPLLQDLYSNI